MPDLIYELTQKLREQGLDLVAELPIAKFSEMMRENPLAAAGDSSLSLSLFHGKRLILIGNSDQLFWEKLCQYHGKSSRQAISQWATDQAAANHHAVDDYVVHTLLSALDGINDGHKSAGSDCQIVFPLDKGREHNRVFSLGLEIERQGMFVPLQRLGIAAGWHQASPLGIGINPKQGLWFAYRAVVLVPQEWSLTERSENAKRVAPVRLPDSELVCSRCIATPCVATCPAKALQFGTSPDMNLCAEFRLRKDSACAHRCLAREVCPVNSTGRYPDQQIQYHYAYSLESMKMSLRRGTSEQQ